MAQLRNVVLASLIYGFEVLGKYVDTELLSPDYIKDMAILTQHEMTSTCFIQIPTTAAILPPPPPITVKLLYNSPQL